MNWLLPAVGLFIILSAWDGHHKGFIRKIVGVLSLALTLIITSVVSPYLHVFLKESTGLYGFLQNSIEGSDMELLDALRVLGMENAVSGYLADEILRWAAFLIALLLAGVLIRGIVFSLGIVSHLPILHGLNKTAGLLLGFAEGSGAGLVILCWSSPYVLSHQCRRPAPKNDCPEQYPVLALPQQSAPELAELVKMAKNQGKTGFFHLWSWELYLL